MIRAIKYRGLIKCLCRGGVNPYTSSADNETWFIYATQQYVGIRNGF